MTDEQDLQVMNFSSKCTGKWTHAIRTTGQSSVLDYVLTSQKFDTKCIKSMVIDELCLLCPFSLKNSKGVESKQFTDHNTIVLEVELERSSGFVRKAKEDQTQRWKVNDEGLSEFFKMTNKDPSGEIGTYDDFEVYLKKCMGECFKPVSKKKGVGVKRNKPRQYQDMVAMLMKYYKQGKVQRKVVMKYLETIELQNERDVAKRMSHALQSRMKQLTIDQKLSLNSFWMLKRTCEQKEYCVFSNERPRC